MEYWNYVEDNKIHNDKILLNELQNGLSLAFQVLFDKYSRKIYAFSFSYLNNSEEAEEIVQEVFLKIWKAREEISTEKSFDSYLFTIAKNAILNTIRKSNYHKSFVEYTKLHPEKNTLLDDELNFNELQQAYEKSVKKLPVRRQEIFRLSRDKGFTNAEIAKKMGISVKTVENQMTSAIADIKRSLQSLGFSGIIFFELFL